jgi:hypothetical protein
MLGLCLFPLVVIGAIPHRPSDHNRPGSRWSLVLGTVRAGFVEEHDGRLYDSPTSASVGVLQLRFSLPGECHCLESIRVMSR